MWRGPRVLATLLLWLSLLQTLRGQLDTADKQALLDLHNELRGSVGGANILQSVSGGLLVECVRVWLRACALYSRAWRAVAASVWRIAEESFSYSYSCSAAGMGRGAGSDGSGVRRGVSLWAQSLSDHQQRSEERGESWVHCHQYCERSHSGGGSWVAAGAGRQLHTGSIAHGALSVGQEVALCMMAGGACSTDCA